MPEPIIAEVRTIQAEWEYAADAGARHLRAGEREMWRAAERWKEAHDLGASYRKIAERTGFSHTHVRRVVLTLETRGSNPKVRFADAYNTARWGMTPQTTPPEEPIRGANGRVLQPISEVAEELRRKGLDEDDVKRVTEGILFIRQKTVEWLERADALILVCDEALDSDTLSAETRSWVEEVRYEAIAEVMELRYGITR